MEGRDWNELPVYCLVEILKRVGIESLVQTVPLVCKSWYEATFYPQCWQKLIFTKSPCLRNSKCFDYKIVASLDHINDADDVLEAFLQFAIGRSHGLASHIVFHPKSRLKQGQIAWIAQRCPSLKLLVLPSYLSYVINFEVSDSICKWKDLEALQVASLIGLKKTIANISENCQNFKHLSVYVPRIDGDVALAIGSQLPKIKTLDLQFSKIERSDLVVILKGCQKLEHLDVRECKGIAYDDEILNLARSIRVLRYEGFYFGE